MVLWSLLDTWALVWDSIFIIILGQGQLQEILILTATFASIEPRGIFRYPNPSRFYHYQSSILLLEFSCPFVQSHLFFQICGTDDHYEPSLFTSSSLCKLAFSILVELMHHIYFLVCHRLRGLLLLLLVEKLPTIFPPGLAIILAWHHTTRCSFSLEL